VLALRSIRLRLTLWYVLLLAIILAGFSAGIYLTLRYNLYANLNDSLQARANDLLPLVSYEQGSPTLSQSVSANSPDLGEQFVRVYDSSGRLTFDTSGEAGTVPMDREAVQRALAGDTVTHGMSVTGEPFHVRIAPIEQNGRVTGALEVGRSAEDVSDALQSLLLILGIAYPVTLAVAGFGGIFLAGGKSPQQAAGASSLPGSPTGCQRGSGPFDPACGESPHPGSGGLRPDPHRFRGR
jgi:hypothetical protein